jgi:YesN/AraC family two-component response regulator
LGKFRGTEDGITIYKRQKFDIVITDIVMPKLDGIGLVKAIK